MMITIAVKQKTEDLHAFKKKHKFSGDDSDTSDPEVNLMDLVSWAMLVIFISHTHLGRGTGLSST